MLLYKVVDAPVMQVVQVVRVSQVLVVVIPQFKHVEKSLCVDKIVHMPVVCNDRSSTSLS